MAVLSALASWSLRSALTSFMCGFEHCVRTHSDQVIAIASSSSSCGSGTPGGVTVGSTDPSSSSTGVKVPITISSASTQIRLCIQYGGSGSYVLVTAGYISLYNGDFELPVQPAATFGWGATGWRGGGNGVGNNGASFVGVIVPVSGNQAGFAQGGGGFFQSITMAPGDSVTFYIINRNDHVLCYDPVIMSVEGVLKWGPVNPPMTAPPGFMWSSAITVNFSVASTDVYTFALEGTATMDCSFLVDNVTVSSTWNNDRSLGAMTCVELARLMCLILCWLTYEAGGGVRQRCHLVLPHHSASGVH